MNVMRINGDWAGGYVLDYHTVQSTYLGDDEETGRPMFDTERTELGESMYRLKYQNDSSVLPNIVGALEALWKRWKPTVDLLVPVPASKPRSRQPVLAVARSLGKRVGVPVVAGCVTRSHDVPEMKGVDDFEERLLLLADAHEVDRKAVEGQKVLLLDDLYRSGATMNAVTRALYDQGCAAKVYALAVTRTRSKR